MPDASEIGRSIIAAAPIDAPDAAVRAFRTVVALAIDGTDWFPGAKTVAGKHLQSKGSVEDAISSVVNSHIAMSGAQGFLTNIGGLAAMIIGAPANLTAVALVQTRMVAAMAHLRGYDLNETRTRHAVVTTLLGQRIVDDLVDKGSLPGAPLVVATAPAVDASLEQMISQRVMTALLTATGGKQVIGLIAKRIPLVGGGVGAATDSWNTAAVARYARDQFISRRVQG